MRTAVVVAAAVSLVSLLGCSKQKAEESGDVLAVINGKPLTTADIEARLSGMTEEARKEFDSPAMMSALIDREVKMRVWAEAARERGLDKTDEFKRIMEGVETTVLAELYSRYEEKLAEEVSEEQIREAYEREKHLYTSGGAVKVRQIVCSTREKALKALDAVKGGMPFEDAVRKFSEDPYTKDKGGDLGLVREDTAIPGLGVDPDFYNALRGMKKGDVGGPIQTRMGYHVVLVDGVIPGKVRPFEEVKGQVKRKLVKERKETGREENLKHLWDKYHVEVNNDAIKKYIGYPMTPEDFIRTLGEVTSSGDKINLCKDMLAQFPHHKYAPYVQFLMGFVYSEELHNYVDAAEAFKQLLEQYPNSKFAAAAQWMLDNMDKPHPPLRNVEDVLEIAKKARGKEVSGD